MKELTTIVEALTANPGGGVLATLVTVEGSSYRRPGARLLVTPAGQRIGSISGGCLEEDVLAHARTVAETGAAKLLVYDTKSENDLVWGVGLGCHGVVQVLLEKVAGCPKWAAALAENLKRRKPTTVATVWRTSGSEQLGTRLSAELSARCTGAGIFRQEIAPPVSLLVFGAGDDARPLARLARELGWHVTIADPRPAYATAVRFPEAARVISGPVGGMISELAPEPGAVAVVMTHHYVHDVPLIRRLLQLPLSYLGLLGPRKRAERIISDLRAAGESISDEQLQRLHAPVGLDVGAETPEEVALAILAEVQAVLAERDARPLRERTRPIH